MEEMKELIIVKASDIGEAFNTLLAEIRILREKVEILQHKEDELKTFSVKEAAKLIGFHYKTILKMVRKGVLVPAHTELKNGRYRVTAASIKDYLQKKKTIKNK